MAFLRRLYGNRPDYRNLRYSVFRFIDCHADALSCLPEEERLKKVFLASFCAGLPQLRRCRRHPDLLFGDSEKRSPLSRVGRSFLFSPDSIFHRRFSPAAVAEEKKHPSD